MSIKFMGGSDWIAARAHVLNKTHSGLSSSAHRALQSFTRAARQEDLFVLKGWR